MGALGASLLAMVAGMPKARENTPEARAALDAARATLLELQRSLLDLVDRDAVAYDLVVAAHRRPKTTDEEKARRAEAIQAAMRAATEVPVETFQACARALSAGRAVATYGNPSASSDVTVGASALNAAMMGALLNVEINIGSLKDTALVERVTADLRAAQNDAAAAAREIFTESGVAELMQKAGARLGGHGHFPED